MAIVKCENKKCKYYDDGFYCTKFVVEMDDGVCTYWKEETSRRLKEKLESLEDTKFEFLGIYDEPLQYHDDINDLS